MPRFLGSEPVVKLDLEITALSGAVTNRFWREHDYPVLVFFKYDHARQIEMPFPFPEQALDSTHIA